MLITYVVCAVTLIGQSYDAPDTKLEPVRIVGDAETSPWPVGSGLIDTGFKTSDAYTDGHFSITAPLYSDMGKGGTLGGTLVFIEPYSSWGEHGEIATSLGFGVRHLWNDQPLSALDDPKSPTGWLDEGVMLGMNGFLDMLSTQAHQQFWQLGLGVEFATRYFELRANRYQPMTGRQEVEDHFLQKDPRQELLTNGKDPFAQGNSIQQDVTFTTFDRYTESIYRHYEQGLKGWDAEAALLVPWLDQWTELWFVGGYADFENQPFGPQLHGSGPTQGWKAGIEWRPVPLVVLNATWFEDRKFTGSNWMVGISFQIPIDPEPGNHTKSFWTKLKDTMHPRSRHLVERAIVPVQRQNTAVKVGSSTEQPVAVMQIMTKVSSRAARVVVTDNVIFVNNGGAQGNGIAAHGSVENGTAEHPFDTIQEGTALASTPASQRGTTPTVFVSGGGAPYNEGIRIEEVSIHYASGGYGVQGYAGKSFGLGRPATVLGDNDNGNSAFVAAEVNFASFQNGGSSASFWIDGFDLRGYVRTVNVHDVRVRGNDISVRDAVGVDAEEGVGGDFFVEISGNRIHAEQGIIVGIGGLAGPILQSPTNARVVIAGNSIDILDHPSIAQQGGILIFDYGRDVVTRASISGNILFGAGINQSTPFYLSAEYDPNRALLLLTSDENNTVSGSPVVGNYQLFGSGGVFGQLLINGHTISFP